MIGMKTISILQTLVTNSMQGLKVDATIANASTTTCFFFS
jgi:hypothetical protein